MLENRIYLKIVTMIIASSVVATALLAAITVCIIINAAHSIVYYTVVSAAFLSLLVSLVVGCHGMIKSLKLLGCEYWNVRIINTSFMIQIVFLCLGLILYLLSLFFIH